MKSKGTIKAGVYVINKSKCYRGELHFLGVCGKSLYMSLWLLCSVCIWCVSACVCMCVPCALTHKEAGGWQWGCFCVTLHLIPLRQGCSMNLEVAIVLTSSQLNTVILLFSLLHWGVTDVLCRFWGSELSYTCATYVFLSLQWALILHGGSSLGPELNCEE